MSIRTATGILAAVLFLAVSMPCPAGTVRTLDGKTYDGDVRFDPKGKVIVTPPGKPPVEIDFANILHVTFAASPKRPDVKPGGPLSGLLGVYYIGKDLSGKYVSRIDPAVQFNWQKGYPVPGIETDAFSVRWTGRLMPPEDGTYTFIARINDGVRLWVDNRKIIDRWTPPLGLKEWKGKIRLKKGKSVAIKMEYYDTGGDAEARLLWTGPKIKTPVTVHSSVLTPAPPPPPYRGGDSSAAKAGQGLLAIYYSTRELAGRAVTRIDPKVDFNWGGNAPLPGLGADNFSVRWIGQVRAPKTERFTFQAVTDDGVRLWINNQKIIDQWQDQSPSEASGAFPLKEGQLYDIRMEYYENNGEAVARLFWSSKSVKKQVIPSDHLVPVSGGAKAVARAAAPTKTYSIQGLVLRSGSVIKARIDRADDSTVRFHRDRERNLSVSTSHVSYILLKEFPPEMATKLPPGRRGVLMRTGDFLEGAVQYIRNGKIRVSSVLFGLRDVSYGEAIAIVYHDPSLIPAPYEVHMTDKSVLMASGFTAEKDHIVVKDISAGLIKVWAREVREIRCGGSRFQPLAETRLADAELPPGLTLADALAVNAMQGGFSLWLDGQPVDRGLAVAAGTTLTYDLRGAYRVFYGKVGTSDGAPAGSRLRFVVLVDGKEAYRSPDRSAGEGALEIAVNVEGAKALSLRVEPSGVLDPAAVAVWSNPVLVRPSNR